MYTKFIELRLINALYKHIFHLFHCSRFENKITTIWYEQSLYLRRFYFVKGQMLSSSIIHKLQLFILFEIFPKLNQLWQNSLQLGQD